MFGKGIRLFKVFGFEVRIDASWLLLAVLIILSLTGGYFPFHYKNLSRTAYAAMGIAGAIGLFLSIIVHELSHSLVARRFGVPMKGITLFMFGGVAQMDEESRTPKGEFLMAVAGPLVSILLAAAFFLVHGALRAAGVPDAVAGVLGYLAWINMILAFFNLLPAFPLDGGRVLRSALWAWKRNLRWATRIASSIGSGFGVALIVLGILALLGGSFVGGLWWCLIGMFLRGISQGSYRQVLIRETLAGEPVRRFMKPDPVTVTADTPVDALVNDYIYRHHFKMFPVLADGTLAGCVSTREVKAVPRQEWPDRRVADIMAPCSEQNTIAPDTDATEALSAMNAGGNSRLMVVDNGRLAGIVALKDLLRFLALKLDLESENEADAAQLRQAAQIDEG
ncbi:MAG: site-2 protease family protein [Lentisphaerae bacterium]|nr:site-2 protease family protein [Lentisphaerota bacterium]